MVSIFHFGFAISKLLAPQGIVFRIIKRGDLKINIERWPGKVFAVLEFDIGNLLNGGVLEPAEDEIVQKVFLLTNKKPNTM